MKETLEKLWNEYLEDGCAVIDTDRERELVKKAAEMHITANELLTGTQKEAVQEYVDALNDIQSLFARKAFLKGCEFAVSFILEAGGSK